jgi:hypothetical protein
MPTGPLIRLEIHPFAGFDASCRRKVSPSIPDNEGLMAAKYGKSWICITYVGIRKGRGIFTQKAHYEDTGSGQDMGKLFENRIYLKRVVNGTSGNEVKDAL